MYGNPMYYPNPMMQTAQQRLQMMEAQYPQFAGTPGQSYPQQPSYPSATQVAPATPVIKGRPVSNEQEANAAMIDFDGSLFIFPDNAHGKIYTKQLGLDGNIIFNSYSRDVVAPAPAQEQPQTAPSQDLSGLVKQTDFEKQMGEIRERFNRIEQRLQNNKGGSK